MIKLAAIAMFVPLVACVDTTPQTADQPSTIDVARHSNGGDCTLPPLPEDSEYVFWRGRTEKLRFPGFYSPQAETFFIWNVGTSLQHNVAYPDPHHSQLYAVFAPGPPGSTHHVAGQDNFDHYHISAQGPGLRTYDVYLVFPGPNFDAATWDSPTSVEGMNAAIAAGQLGAPLLSTQAGFDPLVLKVPVRPARGCGCDHDGDDN